MGPFSSLISSFLQRMGNSHIRHVSYRCLSVVVIRITCLFQQRRGEKNAQIWCVCFFQKMETQKEKTRGYGGPHRKKKAKLSLGGRTVITMLLL